MPYTQLLGNVIFVSSGDGGELVDGKNRRNNLRLQESQPKSLAIEVSSSQSKVSVTVDGTTVRHRHSGTVHNRMKNMVRVCQFRMDMNKSSFRSNIKPPPPPPRMLYAMESPK